MSRIFIITDFGAIEITHDAHILRNLDYTSPRILVEYRWPTSNPVNG